MSHHGKVAKMQYYDILANSNSNNIITFIFGGARGVIVIIVGNEHGDMSSNPGRDWLHFT